MGTVSDEEDYEPSEVESGAAGNAVAEDDSDIDLVSRTLEAHAKESGSDEEHQDISSVSSQPPPAHLSRKRHHLPDYAGAPLKRQRQIFNTDHLSLLNEDIADAAAHLIVEPNSNIQSTQIGATKWTYIEKEVFFSALGRLGRDDLPGIAARVGTKSQLEVRQYIMLLSERERMCQDTGDLRRKTLKPVDIPAALEISHECCFALDEAADDLSLRQENHEIAVEEKRWGDNWLITQSLNAELENQPQPDMPFTDLFVVRNWLKLSDRVFMNSAIPDYNWRYVSEDPPTLRATALSDFHALVKSVTKRLVASTLFMSQLRIKAKKEHVLRTKNLVKTKDVKAAADSLFLKADSRDFWARAPRRLRLDIIGERTQSDDEAKDEGSDDEGIMGYEEVEASLGAPSGQRAVSPIKNTLSSSDEDFDEASDVSPGNLSEDDRSAEETDTVIDTALDDEAIKRDMREAMFFSADYEGTTRARQGLRGRIEREHRMVAEAEDRDIQASREEEVRLWTLLRQPGAPPKTPAKTEERSWRGGRAVYEPFARDWRDRVRYMSEWESLGTVLTGRDT